LQDFYNPKRQKETITVPQLKKGLNFGLKQVIPAEIFLAVKEKEIEAWFIAEDKHYGNILPSVSFDVINSIAGINVKTDSAEVIHHPSVILDQIYKKCGRTSGYAKHEYELKNIIGNLDYKNLYINVRNRNNSLNELLICFDRLIP
jgi:hypothetical protein